MDGGWRRKRVRTPGSTSTSILAPLVSSRAPHQPAVVSVEEEVAGGWRGGGQAGHSRSGASSGIMAASRSTAMASSSLELQLTTMDWLAMGDQVPAMASLAGGWAGLVMDDE